MKHWCSLLCLTVLLTSSCRQEGRPVVRPHSERDTLEYLVSEADLIAVVDIADSFDASKAPHGNLPPSVTASVVKVLKGNRTAGSSITISRSPALLPQGISRSVMALGNGRHLAFFKSKSDHFLPITTHSVLSSDHVTPIWRRDSDTEALSWSEQITFQQAIDDVMAAISKETTPNPHQAPLTKGEIDDEYK